MLSKICQTQKDKYYQIVLCVDYKKSKFMETEWSNACQGQGGER